MYDINFIPIKKYISRSILVVLLFLITLNSVYAQNLRPLISIEPGIHVEVGEEVFFSATGTTYPNVELLKNARYEWDFGDGYSYRYDPNVSTVTRSGIACTHYFMKPGSFMVRLTVKIWEKWTAGFGSPIGEPIAINTVTTLVHVTGEAPMAGFEIQRAPFHNRLAQYLYVQIPAAYRENQTTLRVILEGSRWGSAVLFSKRNLAGEEKVFLDHEPLVQGDYVIIAELLDARGVRIPGGIWRDKFSKRYDGIPTVGIDEHNAFRLNGELFFPIGPFITNVSEFPKFISQANVNMVNTEGYNTTHTANTWSQYLDAANVGNLVAIGPGRGDYNLGGMGRFNFNVDRMAEYVRLGKDKPAMFAWIWQDEPNMGGRTEKVYPPTLAAWAYICHREDPQHPAYNLFLGNDWTKLYGNGLREYDYLASAPFFGGKKWTQDIFSLDLYPISSRKHPSFNFTDMGPYAAYTDAIDRVHANNKNLVPVIPALQPCRGQAVNSWPSVTAEQVYMETWINVIHGVKGIAWFPYFDMANSGRWSAMKKFADQMNVLAPVVLQAAPNRTVADSANVALNRVDTMIREHEGHIYIIAARVTEPDPVPEVKYQGIEPYSIKVNFKVSGLTGYASAEVVDEERTVLLNNGLFTDTFKKNEVHIYDIYATGTPSSRPSTPASLIAQGVSQSQINLFWTDNSNNEDGFKIERCADSYCTNSTLLAILPANVTQYSDTGLAANVNYNYRVRAFNADGNSGYSNTASAKTLYVPAPIKIQLIN